MRIEVFMAVNRLDNFVLPRELPEYFSPFDCSDFPIEEFDSLASVVH